MGNEFYVSYGKAPSYGIFERGMFESERNKCGRLERMEIKGLC